MTARRAQIFPGDFDMSSHAHSTAMPGEGHDPAKMPGHWILARLGKRVLRPGGMAMTRRMLEALSIDQWDDVVEFAPGLGATAQIVLQNRPASYTAVERDPAAAVQVRHWLCANDNDRRIITGEAQTTGLPDACATVVYGEAMLTMQPETRRRQIVAEALRLLKPGGRYAIHELGLQLHGTEDDQAEQIRRRITDAIHHQAYPMQLDDWQTILESQGFEVITRFTVPMALLEPRRLIKDEGLLGAIRFAFRLATHRPERRRVFNMRRTFRDLREHMIAVCLVARKPLTPNRNAS